LENARTEFKATQMYAYIGRSTIATPVSFIFSMFAFPPSGDDADIIDLCEQCIFLVLFLAKKQVNGAPIFRHRISLSYWLIAKAFESKLLVFFTLKCLVC